MIGRIYKIINNKDDKCYIGSTFQPIKYRYNTHSNHHLNHYNISSNSKIIFGIYGIENCNVELIKEYIVVDCKHLKAYEQLWINVYKKKCINKNNPFRIKKLYDKIYQQENITKIQKYRKKYKKDHKEEVIQYSKNYYENNKEKWLKKITCGCGSIHSLIEIKPHSKTKKHINWLNLKNQ